MNIIRRAPPVAIFVLILSGCSAEGKNAERQYEMVDAAQPDTVAGDYERCAAAKRVEQGYLTDGDKVRHQRWVNRVFVMCSIASLRDRNEADGKRP